MTESVFKWVKREEWMLGVSTPGVIRDEVWSKFLEDLAAEDYKHYIGCSIGILEVSAVQRKQAAQALRHNKVAVAVITDDVLVRGVVTAASWLGANTKSFAWKDFDRALQRFDLSDHKSEIMQVVNDLRAECLEEAEARKRDRRKGLLNSSDGESDDDDDPPK